MHICQQCNKVFNSELGLRGHSRIHSKKETKRIKEKIEKYKSQKTKEFSGFLENKYTRIYYRIVNKARLKEYDCYTEKHHILPRSLGGDNSSGNLVILSAREHFICHYLLTKMVDKNTKYYHKMLKAFVVMKASHGDNRYFNSYLYQSSREDFSKAQSQCQSGKNNSQYGTIWVSNIEKELSIKIKNDEKEKYISKGWVTGRIINFKKYKEKISLKETKLTYGTCSNMEEFLSLSPCNKVIYDLNLKNMSTREISEHVSMSYVMVSKRLKVINKLKNPAH